METKGETIHRKGGGYVGRGGALWEVEEAMQEKDELCGKWSRLCEKMRKL